MVFALGVGQVFPSRSVVSPISYDVDVAMYMSADEFQQVFQEEFYANCSCDFLWTNFTCDSAFGDMKGMHTISDKTLVAPSGKAVYFSVVDEVSGQFAVEQFATGNECDDDAVVRGRKHFVLGWFEFDFRRDSWGSGVPDVNATAFKCSWDDESLEFECIRFH